MGGSCSMPLAAYSNWMRGEAGELQLDAAWGDPDARLPVVRVVETALVNDLAQAEALGQRVADRLRAAGAIPPSIEG
jgi:hydroxymethylbilane synthase